MSRRGKAGAALSPIEIKVGSVFDRYLGAS